MPIVGGSGNGTIDLGPLVKEKSEKEATPKREKEVQNEPEHVLDVSKQHPLDR